MSGTEMDEMVTTGGRVWIPKADHAREVEGINGLLKSMSEALAAGAEARIEVTDALKDEMARHQKTYDTMLSEGDAYRETIAKLERRIAELEADTA